MSARFFLNKLAANSFSDLVAAHPISAFGSPTRSTLPLLDYWRSPDDRLSELARIIGGTPRSEREAELVFEHEVSVQLGSGKPSCTDLLIRFPSTSITIEAKFTEPRYETVKDWLTRGDLCNRIDVLRGWISLLEAASQRQLAARSISALPYQLIHRAASACAASAEHPFVVYHIFKPDVSEYVQDVESLASLLGTKSDLRLVVLSTPITSSDEHRSLQHDWRSKVVGVPERLRAALVDRGLFEFGSTTVAYASRVAAAG